MASSSPTMPMMNGKAHLIFATICSRGHVQPCIAAGKELRRRGYSITIATHEDYRALVESHGLNHRSVCGSFRALTGSPAGLRWIASAGDPIAHFLNYRKLFGPHAGRWIRDFELALDDADGVIVEGTALPAFAALEAMKVPHVALSAMPLVPSGEIGATGLPRIPVLTPALEIAYSKVLLNLACLVGDSARKEFLLERGLRPSSDPLWKQCIGRDIGHLFACSEAVIPRPTDWPDSTEMTGFCFLDSTESWRPPVELARFLDKGPSPIYATYGPAASVSADGLSALTVEALREAGHRGVIGIRDGSIANSWTDEDMIFIKEADYNWLFPKVAAAIHYGGVGTASAVLRAGRPSVVTPFAADQPFWARRLFDLGVSPKPVTKKHFNAETLASRLAELTSDSSYLSKANEVGQAIRSENGSAFTADRIIHYLNL